MNPNQAQRRLQSGIQQLQAGNFAGAEADFRAVLKIDRRNFTVLNLLAVALMQQRRFADAEPCLRSACAVNSSNAATLYNYGLVLNELGRPKDALAQFDKVVAIEPANADAWNSRGLALKAVGLADDAIESYRKATALRPDHADAYYNIGNVLQGIGRAEEALASYDRAISLNPGHADAHCNRANVLQELGRFDDALASVDRAIVLRPGLVLAHYNRGGILKAMERYEDALASFDRAIVLKADYADALQNRGSVLVIQRRYAEAIEDFDAAIGHQPGNAETHYNKGIALASLARHPEAAASLNRAFSLDPEHLDALTLALHAEMQSCDWHAYKDRIALFTSACTGQAPVVQPFALFPTPASPRILKQAAEAWTKKVYPAAKTARWNGKRYGHQRPRVAYLSPDFRNHPVAFLIVELFEKHDRDRIDLYGFSLGPDTGDDMQRRIAGAFPQFYNLRGKTSLEIAELAQAQEIDIAVDLSGLTDAARTEVFALRPAPVQVNYLGFPGTMGAPYIDYIVADPVLIPPAHFDNYSEKVVHLPHSFQVNDTQREVSSTVPSRAELGLPENGFVLCCFNNGYKITPDVFDIWMRVLTKVRDSVLWLRQAQEAVRANLIAEAAKRGIAAERLVFAPRTETVADHLARQRQADLFVDTFYYNAHTTASDALWAGLPVVTCAGETYASRVAASLLNAVGLPELVARSHSEYENLILHFAAERAHLAEIRARLGRNIKTHPLFDIGSFTRHIEDAYLEMWRRAENGQQPDHIAILP